MMMEITFTQIMMKMRTMMKRTWSPPRAPKSVRATFTPTTTAKASAKAVLDMSADDGVGNMEDSDDEEEEPTL
jgi:hypothetical protein